MNVTFHVLGSFATAAVLAERTKTNYAVKLCVGFVTGILIHGILDFLPHQYPLSSKIDIGLALLLLLMTLFFVRKQYILLILVCFAGSIFPDIIDLAPSIADKHLGVTIQQLPFRVFPWHLKKYSGSIYDGSRWYESTLYHSAFTVLCLSVLYLKRKNLFRA
jgi:hypothetical protein